MFASLQRRLIYRPVREKVIHPEQAGLNLENVTPVQIKTHDKLILNGWHVAARLNDVHSASDDADICNGASRGLIIYFPGNAKNRRFRGLNFLTLTALRTDVLLVDYRGYAENPGSPREEDIACDARAILDFAVGQLGVPLSKIVLLGESLGGAVATRLAAEISAEKAPAAGLVLGWTFPSLADAGSNLYPWLPVRTVLVERYRTIDRIGDVRSPLLMLHGREDEILPLEMGRQLFHAAPERSEYGVGKQFVELSAGHNNVYRVAGEELQAAVRRFLEQIWNREASTSAAQISRENRLENTLY